MDNKKKLKIFIGFCIFAGLFGVFKSVIDAEKAEELRKVSYTANITLEQKKEMQKNYADKFMGYLNVQKIEEAYEMLDDSSKEEFSNNIEEFREFTTKKLYNNEISPKIYDLSYVKQQEKGEYLELQYLIRFKILDSSKLDYSQQETLDFRE